MVTYEDIYRNIASFEVRGDSVVVTWKCPVAERVVGTTEARMKPRPAGLGGDVKEELVAGAIRSARGMFAQLAGELLGWGARSTLDAIGGKVEAQARQNNRYGQEQQKEAILLAWQGIEARFTWSATDFLWIARE